MSKIATHFSCNILLQKVKCNKEGDIMECPKCNKKVSELDEKCPYCGLDFKIYQKEKNIKKVGIWRTTY